MRCRLQCCRGMCCRKATTKGQGRSNCRCRRSTASLLRYHTYNTKMVSPAGFSTTSSTLLTISHSLLTYLIFPLLGLRQVICEPNAGVHAAGQQGQANRGLKKHQPYAGVAAVAVVAVAAVAAASSVSRARSPSASATSSRRVAVGRDRQSAHSDRSLPQNGRADSAEQPIHRGCTLHEATCNSLCIYVLQELLCWSANTTAEQQRSAAVLAGQVECGGSPDRNYFCRGVREGCFASTGDIPARPTRTHRRGTIERSNVRIQPISINTAVTQRSSPFGSLIHCCTVHLALSLPPILLACV